MLADRTHLTVLDRILRLFTRTRPGEGRSVLLFFLIGFDFMFCQWVLKPVREAILGEAADPTMGTYATAVIAVLLMFLVPFYSVLFKHQQKIRLVQTVNLFFIVCLILFVYVGEPGLVKGFIFYVWVGIFSVMMITQFWAFAADHFNVKSGQRLFAVLAAGVSLGAWLGSVAQSVWIETLGADGVLLATAAILLFPVFLMSPAAASVPKGSRSTGTRDEVEMRTNFLGGFHLIARDTYLKLIAAFVVLQNLIDTTGDYILRVWIFREADRLTSVGECADKSTCIGVLYGDVYGWMNLLALLSALFLVSRVIRFIGMRGAIMVLPTIMVIGYSIIAFVPVFSVIRIIKIIEKSTNYSLNNTVRHALFLPTSESAKYEGKTTIDTFFWRFGDLLTAGIVFLGVERLDLGVQQFAIMNIAIAAVFLGLALLIGRYYRELAVSNVMNVAPELIRPIPDVEVSVGEAFRHALHPETFVDADPGDVLELTARLSDGSPLPRWLSFDARRLQFHGTPAEEFERLEIKVIASDVDGETASASFVVRCLQALHRREER